MEDFVEKYKTPSTGYDLIEKGNKIHIYFYDVSTKASKTIVCAKKGFLRIPLWAEKKDLAPDSSMVDFMGTTIHKVEKPSDPFTNHGLRYLWIQAWLGKSSANLEILKKMMKSKYFFPFAGFFSDKKTEKKDKQILIRLSSTKKQHIVLEIISSQSIERIRIYINKKGEFVWNDVHSKKKIIMGYSNFMFRLERVSEDPECSICYVNWEGKPIFENNLCGHVLCGNCAKKVHKCPLCRKNWKSKKTVLNSIVGEKNGLSMSMYVCP